MSYYTAHGNRHIPLRNASAQSSRPSTSRARDGPLSPDPASPVLGSGIGPKQASVFSPEVVAAFREASKIIFAGSPCSFDEKKVCLPSPGTVQEIRMYRDLCREFFPLPESLKREVLVRHTDSLPLHAVPSIAIVCLTLFGIPSSTSDRFAAIPLVGELFVNMLRRFHAWEAKGTWRRQCRHNPALSPEANAMCFNDLARTAIGQSIDIEAQWLDLMLIVFGDVPEFWGLESSPSSVYRSALHPSWEMGSGVPTGQPSTSTSPLAGQPNHRNASVSAAQAPHAGDRFGLQDMGQSANPYASPPFTVRQTLHSTATPTTVYDGVTSQGELNRLDYNVSPHPLYDDIAYRETLSPDSTTAYSNAAWSGMDVYNGANPSRWNALGGDLNGGIALAPPAVPHAGAFSPGASTVPGPSTAALGAGTVNPAELLASPRVGHDVEGSGVPFTAAKRSQNRRSVASASISSRGSKNSSAPTDVPEQLALEQAKAATLSLKLTAMREQTLHLSALARISTSHIELYFGGLNAFLSARSMGLPIPEGHLDALLELPSAIGTDTYCLSLVVNEQH